MTGTGYKLTERNITKSWRISRIKRKSK